jgi:hypothetical protein
VYCAIHCAYQAAHTVKTEVIKTGTLEGLTVPAAPLKAPTVVFEQQGVKVMQ